MNKNLKPSLFTLCTNFCATGLNVFSKENMSHDQHKMAKTNFEIRKINFCLCLHNFFEL